MKKILFMVFVFTSLGFSQLIKPNKTSLSLLNKNNYNSLYTNTAGFSSGLRDTIYSANIGLGVGNLQNNIGISNINQWNNIIGYANLNRDSTLPKYNNIIGNQNLYYSQGSYLNTILGNYNLFYSTTNIKENVILGNFNAYSSAGNNIYSNIMLGDSNFYNLIQNLNHAEVIGYNNVGFLGNPFISTNTNIEILGSNNMPGIRQINNVQIVGDNNLSNEGNNSQYGGGIQILGSNCLNVYAQSQPGQMIAIGYGSGAKVISGTNDCYIQSAGLGSADTNMLYLGGFAVPYIYGSYSLRYLRAKVLQLGVDSLGGTLAYHTIVGRTDRTAGIDSLTSGVDTVYTTAYDANSLVFITDLSAAGTPGHQYIDKINSVPGSYFIVISKSALDNSFFNWFILKTY